MIMSRKPARVPQLRCAIYTRKSTEEGLDQEFNSLDAQREAGEAYIASQKQEGWTAVPERYDDGGFTGGNMERPALKRLLDDIDAGNIDIVIVYKVDRLSRSLLDFARLIETFERHKVAFVSVTQQFNSATSMGRLVLNVLLSFAQFEREIIGERIRDKIAATKKKGKWTGGFPVLGYDVDRSNGKGKLVVNAVEACQVRAIFDLYLRLGSLLPVVDELNRRGWVTKTNRTSKNHLRGGRAFDRCSLYELLINPVYIGQVRHKKDVYPGEHQAIVDEGTFDKVREMMKQNANCNSPTIRNRHGALLRGLLFCKGCDRVMSHTFTCKGPKRYRYYTCTAAMKRGRKSCATPSLPTEQIERVVIDQIRDIANNKHLREEVLRHANTQLESELAEWRLEKAAVLQELARLRAATQTPDLQEKIAHYETRSGELERRIEQREVERLNARSVKEAFANFDSLWASLPPREQVELTNLLVARVEFDPVESAVSVSFHPDRLGSLVNTQTRGAT